MRRRLPDILILALLFALPLVMFWQQTLGGRTLLPTENLYQFEPFATYREVVRAPEPHNALVSDLILENYQWKTFIRQSIARGEIPLWNPHQFAGIPFLAAGQQSTLYPFSILYYVMPLTAAYGWFTVVQLWLAGAFMYAFTRGLGLQRTGAVVSGIVYQLSAFFVISAVFPMIIAAAAWLPLLLLMIEYVIRQQPALRGRPATIPWVAIGAVALGCNILAGHVEITYYTLIIMAYYAAARLLWLWWQNRRPVGAHGRVPLRHAAQRAFWLATMVALGIGIGAVQFIPLYELASTNWRSGSASYEQVIGWAHPLRDLVQFVMPNFYGNPSHHSYFDVFTGQVVTQFTRADGTPTFPPNTIDWGIKNYVEGALYLGILPLVLSVYALVDGWLQRRTPLPASPEFGGGVRAVPYRGIFALLGLVSLTFMFGLPTYAILYYGFPGINQLHSPFRWIFGLTLSVAVLAGFGAEALARVRDPLPASPEFGGGDSNTADSLNSGRGGVSGQWARRIGWILIGVGAAILVGLALSRVFYAQIEPQVERIFTGMARADEAFSNARMFYSYQFRNVLFFGLFTLAAGIVMRVSRCGIYVRNPLPASPEFGGGEKRQIPVWEPLAVMVVALDLLVASWGFNPASDPLLLDFTPPAIQWLQGQPGDWRYTTLDDPTQRPIMQANTGWRYGLDDIRGYESIIPGQYVEYMQQLAPQVQLDFNRIAPLYTAYPEGIEFDYRAALESPLLDLLNVRYLITHKSTTLPDELTAIPKRGLPAWRMVYEDEAVRIWENGWGIVPRAYTVVNGDLDNPITGWEVTTLQDTGREKLLNVRVDEPQWLVVSETYMPGWRAFIRLQHAPEADEQPLDVQRVQGNFQGVFLPEAGQWTVRLVYSPASFQTGAFGTFISVVLVIFLVGVWLWRLYVARDEQASGASVVARNSVAPIILNLFNRGIDFAFAFVMLRILGPEGAGIYYYAVIVFGWFDIFTNFGLNTFLTREVSRDRSQARRYLYNTSILRVLLMLAGVALLAAFIGVRQSIVSPPLSGEALLAIGLLYVGLLPNSLSTGLSALFYAFEQAEVPAAIATAATISKAVFGVLALMLGYGVVGLAGVSILTNLITLAIMGYVGRGLISPPAPSPILREGEETLTPTLSPSERGEQIRRDFSPDWPLIRRMVGESWPLLLNHFLQTIFLQIDVIIIEAYHGERMVGQYSVAYKWLLALNVIPAFFTMALLPVMSRQAREDRAALKRTYALGIKLLVSTALPIAVLFTFLAEALTVVLGGAAFLPDGAIATQLMMWSIPIGWMNSLTQYVLIALDLQRRITWAFIAAVSFNIVANLIFVPQYGYRAAALITIASEAILLVPFGLLLRGALGTINWPELVWRPLVATGMMLAFTAAGWAAHPVIGVVLGMLAYPVVLLALRPFDEAEIARLRPLLPGKGATLTPSPSPSGRGE